MISSIVLAGALVIGQCKEGVCARPDIQVRAPGISVDIGTNCKPCGTWGRSRGRVYIRGPYSKAKVKWRRGCCSIVRSSVRVYGW